MTSPDHTPSAGDGQRVYVTRGLLSACCRLAADADPEPVSISLAATAAGDLSASGADDPGERAARDGDAAAARERTDRDGAVPDATTPVLTDFYFPGAGDAVNSVFGMDLGVPPGQTHARFVSHPDGDPGPAVTDDFHAVLLVATPPWNPAAVQAHDRQGRSRDLVRLRVDLPDRTPP
ncbi:MAG: hypothetical protein ABEJ08_00825 [Halobacteriaceae archaeon]